MKKTIFTAVSFLLVSVSTFAVEEFTPVLTCTGAQNDQGIAQTLKILLDEKNGDYWLTVDEDSVEGLTNTLTRKVFLSPQNTTYGFDMYTDRDPSDFKARTLWFSVPGAWHNRKTNEGRLSVGRESDSYKLNFSKCDHVEK